MAASLYTSLDDIIIKNTAKHKSGSYNHRRRAPPSRYGPGPDRRFPNHSVSRAAPYVEAPETKWKHDLYAEQNVVAYSGGRASSSMETETKLYITNLDYGVSDDDIKELFSEVGVLKNHGIHYDKSGRSKGTAEVVFLRGADAVAAVKRYNNVQLDGKLMKIEVVGANISIPVVVPPAYRGLGTNAIPQWSALN
ncbi:hypothetical protein RIF29_32025 [Crotalaria pallida]|uniref:RRM domain-containing protein n=1 Tax=Crotalaria pallida TaxID=3830 RepID=A0AAN9EPX0_CROPI